MAAIGPMAAARTAVSLSTLVAAATFVGLYPEGGVAQWAPLAGFAAGALARRIWREAAVPVTLAAGVLWPVAYGTLSGRTDADVVMPWLAAVAGVLFRAGPWHLPRPWAVPVATWGLVVALTWPIAAARELDFTTATIGVASTASSSFGGSATTTAAWIAVAGAAQLAALLVFEWSVAAGAAWRRRLWQALAPAVLAACVLAIWQALVDPALASRAPWIALRRASGPFYDANATGAIAALLGPVGALAASRRPGWRGALGSVAWLALTLAAVVASGSRTALLGWVVTVGLSAGAMLALAPRQRRIVAVAGLAAVLGIAWAGARGPGSTAVQRVAESVREVTASGLPALADILWVRYGYGPAAAAAIAEHPWFGVGPGAFDIVAPDYGRLATGVVLPPDNAQNWWRHQWAELGLVGAAAPWACSGLLLLATLRTRRRERMAPIVAVGLMSVVGPPSAHPVLAVLIGALIARAIAPDDEAGVPPPTPAAAAWLSWVVALVAVAGFTADAQTFRPPQRAARFQFPFVYGLTRVVDPRLGDGWWAERRSVAVFGPAAGTLDLRITVPDGDLAGRPVSIAVAESGEVHCAVEVRDASPVDCVLPIPGARWPLVGLAFSRAAGDAAHPERAAFVTARARP
ncbi:MAG: O-antigen ligase family protein [Vicinamibacterales bacterium]